MKSPLAFAVTIDRSRRRQVPGGAFAARPAAAQGAVAAAGEALRLVES